MFILPSGTAGDFWADVLICLLLRNARAPRRVEQAREQGGRQPYADDGRDHRWVLSCWSRTPVRMWRGIIPVHADLGVADRSGQIAERELHSGRSH